jgi:hypothetical protein
MSIAQQRINSGAASSRFLYPQLWHPDIGLQLEGGGNKASQLMQDSFGRWRISHYCFGFLRAIAYQRLVFLEDIKKKARIF